MDNTVHGILQAKILECVAFPFSRGSSWPRNQTRSLALQADSLPAEPPRKLPHYTHQNGCNKKTVSERDMACGLSLFVSNFTPGPPTAGLTWSPTTFSSVQFSHSVVSDSLRPHKSQHARPPCPSQTPRVCSNSCPSSWWCHPAISSSVVPFSSCPQSLLASGSFPTSQLFAWGGQSIGVSASASVLPMNTQDLSPSG